MKTKQKLVQICLLCAALLPAVVGAQTQVLQGHVPAIVKSLQPLGRLSGTNRLNLAVRPS
jgi:hypothetical protein